MNDFPWLLAAGGDLITVAVLAVLFITWLIFQIAKAAKGAQPPQRGANFPANPAARPPQGAAAQKVDDEIAAFLRRAAQARVGGNPPAVPPRPQPQRGQPLRPAPQRVQPGLAQRPAQPPRMGPGQQPLRPPVSPPLRPRAAPAQRAQVVPVELIEEGSDHLASVEQHVAQHLDTRGFADRASHITTVDQADEQMETQIHQALDHEVGTLTSGSATAGPVPAAQQAQRTQLSTYAAASAGLAVVLADPQNLRQAIILNEVLRRPDFDR